MKVIVIGTGKVALGCLKILFENSEDILYIEPEEQFFSIAKQFCRSNKIGFFEFYDKNDLALYFKELNEKTLIISAHNKFIFPAGIVSKENLFIVNYHNSLLPKYRGMNPPAWAIFNMDKQTGVTWHKIDDRIDTGDIICQRAIDILDTDTSFTLTEKCAELGVKMFSEIFPSLIKGEVIYYKQENVSDYGYHSARDIPNEGILNIEWDIIKISCFLRAMDYGKFDIFPKPVVILDNSKYKIINYEIMLCAKYQSAQINFDYPFLEAAGKNLRIKMKLEKI